MAGPMRARILIPMIYLAAITQGGAQQSDTARAPSDSGSARWAPMLLGTQMNFIHQRLIPFSAPYDGPNSLQHGGDAKTSEAYGAYTGLRIVKGLEGYLDVEMIRGRGVSRTVGLAGISNGDVIRQGSADLGDGPYIARLFLRYTIGLEGPSDTLTRAMDQLPGIVKSNRVEVTLGKFALTDLFDLNRYANTTRWQFMNWGLFQNTAWDYAADTRGYSNGIAVSWVHPWWSLRAAVMQMPSFANGNKFDSGLDRAHGSQAELTVRIPRLGGTVRALAYENEARMGRYAVVLASARATRPDIVSDDAPGRKKYGWGVNVEQPIADDGETGAFFRYGWDDGATESFAFTEVDRHLSGGAQVSGAHWRRSADRFGLAMVRHGIVRVHQDYLAAGGNGFLLGDGRLLYGAEQIIEAYYRVQVGPWVQVSPDYQYIQNPGYNRERGPASTVSLRLNVRY
jgi:high affinity Mn2+ porin